MVTYHLEHDALVERWTLIASWGNDLSWEVGFYRDKARAELRLDRILKIAEAQQQVEHLG